jgi:hypothetical protein
MDSIENKAQSAVNALLAITQPTVDAVDALKVEAQTQIADLTNKLLVATNAIAADSVQIQKLKDQIAALSIPAYPGFSDMQMHGNWEVHPGSEAGIGSWTPGTTFSQTQYQKQGDAQYAMKLSIKPVTGGYSDVLWAIHRRPVPKPAAKMTLKGRLWIDDNTGVQCLEIDSLVTLGGYKYNMSSQINYSKGGMLQVAHGSTSWFDTPIVVGKLTTGVWHEFQWEYAYDTVAKTLSFLAFTLDGVRFTLPTQFQNIAPIATNWSDGVHLQLQLDANNKGVGYSVWYDRLSYTFE